MSQTIGIGIMGLGTVGYGAATILQRNRDVLSIRTKCDLELVAVLEREKETAQKHLEEIGLSAGLVTDDIDAFLNTEGLDIVVEVIGGTTVAKTFIEKAIAKGKSIVTANKDLMAIHGKELLNAATEQGVDLRFEASVAGGIPIIDVLKTDLIGNHFDSIMGIVNGTTNYILTRMYHESIDFDDVLKEAQRLGYAESDPTADIGGWDAARKVAILASIAYNSRVTLDDVYVEGIDKITAEDIAAARKLGYVIKLLGIAKEDNGAIEARVHPVMIPTDHPLAAVNDTFNAVFVDGDVVGQTMFYGRGAGDLPTGSAIVGDICAVARDIVFGDLGQQGCTCYLNKAIKTQNDYVSKFFIRMQVEDSPGVLSSIAKIFGENGVSIASVVQERCKCGGAAAASLIVVTHKVQEGKFLKAKQQLESSEAVHGIDNIIRVEDEA
ncbi:MAG TPA: homoserine dehydrogenase [Firmicutes bacterium]|nr:homoserine dehydrogenase [Bacillota bacterium]